LTEYGEDIRTQDRYIALVDQRSGDLLDHHWMTEENMKTLLKEASANNKPTPGTVGKASPAGDAKAAKPPVGGLANLRLFPSTMKRLATESDNSVDQIVRDASYRDPVSRLDPESFGGEWLAAFAPVADTGWTVIVQERKAAALRPVAELRADMIEHGVVALVVSGALIGLLWYFVLRAINDRVLRMGPWRGDGLRTEGGTSLSTVGSQR
jgi:hypothetical protein